MILGPAWRTNRDPYFKNNVFLLLPDRTGTTFYDHSIQNRKTIINVNSAQNDTNNRIITRSALLTDPATSDATNKYLYTAPSTDYNFGTADFCVDAWFRVTGTSPDTNQCIVSTWPGATGWNLTVQGFGTPPVTLALFAEAKLSGSQQITQTPTLPLVMNRWYWAAWGRTGTTSTIWLDGVQAVSVFNNQNVQSNGDNLTVGRNSPDGSGFVWRFNGQIGPVRVTKGVNRFSGMNIPVPRNLLDYF